jgi:hypothetical protein
VAFWHIARFLTAHPLYRDVPFANMRRVQQSIALGNYCCLGDGKTMQAVVTWREINVAALLRTYPRYAADDSATMDGVFMTSLAGADRARLKIIIAHLRKVLGDKDVYWDRHNGKLGHRAATPQAAPPAGRHH